MSTPHEEFDLPGTDLARAAYRLAEESEEAYLFNHSVRTYLFARGIGHDQGLRPDEDYDDELLFLGCVLHDLGLTEDGEGGQRFEVAGADAAARFLRGHGVAEDRVEVVWDAIALHTSPGIAGRKRPEIALVHLGSGADVLGLSVDRLPASLVHAARRRLPRLDLTEAITAAIVEDAKADPRKAPPLTFPSLLVAEYAPEHAGPTWRQLTATPDPVG
ncbi:HD domain-containing protein [Saccharothrix hoggarensis]|uniref:HD domain-containing protein n=1 Tax=Saccharothrix hoggarensis TaxID=913853 RepID=A0ABW3QWT5_9PSEU